jgi:hypothetical protein
VSRRFSIQRQALRSDTLDGSSLIFQQFFDPIPGDVSASLRRIPFKAWTPGYAAFAAGRLLPLNCTPKLLCCASRGNSGPLQRHV